jgi:hypothetical protein
MGGAGVDRPPSLICPRASAWRVALLPSLHGERLALMCRGSRSRRGEQRLRQSRPRVPLAARGAFDLTQIAAALMVASASLLRPQVRWARWAADGCADPPSVGAKT